MVLASLPPLIPEDDLDVGLHKLNLSPNTPSPSSDPIDTTDPFASLPPIQTLPYADLLTSYETINVLAPLVRCSKLPFRHLVSLYDTHVTHTPMILAQEFSRAQIARVSDFTTSSTERGVFWMEPRRGAHGAGTGAGADAGAGPHSHPEDEVARVKALDREWKTYHVPRAHSRLPPSPTPPTARSELVRGVLIAQMACHNGPSLADAAELIAPYVDGLDVNCGCPQKWAYEEGIGSALLRKPELVADMVRCVKDRLGWGWPVSVKIRIDPEQERTEQLVQSAIHAGVSHITIHGRTRRQPSTDPVNLDGIRFAVECAKGQVPCVGNGDIWTNDDARVMREHTGVRGVMAARGLLANPALFAGYDKTPRHAVEQFVNVSVDYGLIFPLFHKHLAYMLESHFSRGERVWFNQLASSRASIDYLAGRGFDFVSARGTPWDAQRGRSVL